MQTEPGPVEARSNPRDSEQGSKIQLAQFQTRDAGSGSSDVPPEDPVPPLERVQTVSQTQTPGNAGGTSDVADSIQIDEAAGDGENGVVPADAKPLTLAEVLQSVTDCYPEINIALAEITAADGKVISSWGNFDTLLAAESIAQPLGFYQTYRNGIQVERPVFGGGNVYGGYRIGDGNFEPWYGERETNEGGELKAGFAMPLIKDRGIDARRAQLFSSQAVRDQVESNVNARFLILERMATQAYWDWVATGQVVQIQQRLLDLALKRVDGINARIEEQDLAEIARIDNNRFIAKRKNSLIKARRGLEKAAIKLSLFWRDAQCNPIIVTANQLPVSVPEWFPIADAELQTDIAGALSVRPELAELRFARQEACVALRYARNLTLPKLDVKGFAGQDLGGDTSTKGDKSEFELQVGLFGEVPIQRREGLGKIQSAQAKISQIDSKIRFQSDKIRAEIIDAASAVNAAYEQIQQSSENLQLALQALELGQLAFDAGDIDLIALNIYETSVADAELELLDARFKYFTFRTVYETAIRGTAF